MLTWLISDSLVKLKKHSLIDAADASVLMFFSLITDSGNKDGALSALLGQLVLAQF